jgi:hypothetical protein
VFYKYVRNPTFFFFFFFFAFLINFFNRLTHIKVYKYVKYFNKLHIFVTTSLQKIKKRKKKNTGINLCSNVRVLNLDRAKNFGSDPQYYIC